MLRRLGTRPVWFQAACCCALILSRSPACAEVGLTSQPEPLGYPSSIDDEADTKAEEAAGSIWPAPKRVDEPQVPAGFDPYRSPGYAGQPSDFISWGKEPTPCACCDRHLVDREWMGPGELAYHKSPNHRPCTRDHTRVFRTEFPGRLWFSAEYLVWATTGQSVPVLITSSPTGTPVANIGVIGNANTTTLFGGNNFNGPMRSGARLTTGFWFTPRQERGIEASWLGLAVAKETLNMSTTGGNPWLAQPYVDAGTGLPEVVIVPTLTQPDVTALDPNLLEQSVDAQLSTQFGSVDVLYRTNLTVGEDFHRRYLCGGFRYLMLDDRLTVDSSSVISTGTPGGYPLNGYRASDSFKTLSQFYGGEFGLIEKRWRDRWSLQFLGKIALGASTIGSAISGSTTTTETTNTTGTPVTTVTSTSPGGVLAQTTNLGSKRSLFAGMGEFGVTADYAIWSQFRLSVGYSLIYWTTVGRVTDQVDTAVNPKHTGNLWTTSFWAQGVNAGLEYQF